MQPGLPVEGVDAVHRHVGGQVDHDAKVGHVLFGERAERLLRTLVQPVSRQELDLVAEFLRPQDEGLVMRGVVRVRLRQPLVDAVTPRPEADEVARGVAGFGHNCLPGFGVPVAYQLAGRGGLRRCAAALHAIECWSPELGVPRVDQAASPTETLTRLPSRRRARSIVAALVAWSGLSMRRTSLSATSRSRARRRCDTPTSRKAS